MAEVLWQLFLVNLISTFDFVIAPLRVAMTMGAVDTLPWWLVLLVASTGGALGALPIYFLTRWKIAHPWQRNIAVHPRLALYRARWHRHIFLWQIVLCSIPYIDLVGVGLAGCERYSFRRFLPAPIIGRCIHNAPLVFGGLILAKLAWFQAFIGAIRHPITGFILLLLLTGGIIAGLYQINKSRAVD